MALPMSKRVEKVQLIMTKLNIPSTLRAEVKFELDCSGSTMGMFSNGSMQELVERLLAIALRLDGDGKLEVTSFSDSAKKLGDVTAADVDNYINKRYIPESKSAGTWSGGTNYAAAIKTALGKDPIGATKGFLGGLFKKAAGGNSGSTHPNFHLFVSDGQDGGNRNDFLNLISECKDTDYFMLIGVGPSSYFQLMKQAADAYDNVGFVNFPNLSISDDEMYEQLLAGEALNWLLARQAK